MSSATASIPARFNGPPTSGNGGYACGVLAAHVDGAARVRLHVPPPLDVQMTVQSEAEGTVAMYNGDTLVGSAGTCELELDIPAAPSLEEARDASSRYAWYDKHTFDTCFVCGPKRPAHDGLELFPGPVHDWNLIACPWTPAEDLLDDKGCVGEEYLWSALDCPGFFAGMGAEPRPALLGQLEGRIVAPAQGGQDFVVYAWPLGEEGRKVYAGTAIATAEGTVVAFSRSTWIIMKSA